MDKKALKAIYILPVFLLVLSLALTGCGLFGIDTDESGQETDTVVDSGTAADETLTSNAVTTITLWDCLDPRERIALMESRDQFLAGHGNINIETRHFRSQEELEDQFEAASLAGAGPQLILLDFDGVKRLAASNVAKEITDEVDYSIVLGGLAEIASYSGREYIVPFRAYDFLTLLYNRELVEEVPEDFEGVFTYMQKVEDEGEAGEYGFLLNERQADWVIPFVGGYNGWIIDYASNSLTLDSQAMQKTLEFLDYSYNQSGLMESGMEYGDINSLFKSGDAHMIIDYYSTAEEYREAGIDAGAALIPKVWGGSRYPTPTISGLGFIINVNTYEDRLDAAREFITFMLTDEVQAQWNESTLTMNVLTGMDTGSDPVISAAFEQAKICRGKPDDQLLMVIRNAINDNVESMLAGDILPEDAALKIQDDAIRLKSSTAQPEEDVADTTTTTDG